MADADFRLPIIVTPPGYAIEVVAGYLTVSTSVASDATDKIAFTLKKHTAASDTATSVSSAINTATTALTAQLVYPFTINTDGTQLVAAGSIVELNIDESGTGPAAGLVSVTLWYLID